jgi:hypothetical protein
MKPYAWIFMQYAWSVFLSQRVFAGDSLSQTVGRQNSRPIGPTSAGQYLQSCIPFGCPQPTRQDPGPGYFSGLRADRSGHSASEQSVNDAEGEKRTRENAGDGQRPCRRHEDDARLGGNLHDVCHRVRQDILSGELEPGEILNQVHIARRYGVIRTPVREALHMLQAENLGDAQCQCRTRVTKVTSQEVVRCMQRGFSYNRLASG